MSKPIPRAVRTSSLVRDRRATSALEFALIANAFLIVIFAVTEFGRLMWIREALLETAITAARCMGVLNSNCASGGAYSSTATTTYIENVASGWYVQLPSTGIAINNAATCGGVSGFSTVTLTYTYQTTVPVFLPSLVGPIMTESACFPNQPA